MSAAEGKKKKPEFIRTEVVRGKVQLPTLRIKEKGETKQGVSFVMTAEGENQAFLSTEMKRSRITTSLKSVRKESFERRTKTEMKEKS